jgi:O-Antigen ligase
MQIHAKIKQAAPYAYLILLVASSAGITFFRAGHSFTAMTIWSFVILPLFAIWLLAPKNFQVVAEYKMVFVLTFILSIVMLVGFLFPPYANFGLRDFTMYAAMPFIYFSLATMKLSKDHLRWLFRFMSFVAIVFCLYGFYRYITFPYDRLTGPFLIDLEWQTEFFPNAFAFFLMFIIPIQTLYLFNQSKKNYWTIGKISIYISSIILFAGFFLTFSRAAVIAMLALSIVFIAIQIFYAVRRKIFFRGRSIKVLLIVFIASFFIMSGLNFFRSLQFNVTDIDQRFDLSASGTAVSFADRFDHMRGAMLLAKDYPLFGIGTDNFQFLYPQYQEVPRLAKHPSNMFLKVFVATGMISGILALSIYGLYAYYFFVKFKYVEQKYYMSIILFSLLASMIQSLVDYNVNFILNNTMLSIFLALFITRFPLQNQEENATKGTEAKKYPFASLWVKSYLGFIVILITFVVGFEMYTDQFVNNAQIAYSKGDYIEAAKQLEIAADKKFFKEDFLIQAVGMYEIAYDETGDKRLFEKWGALIEKSLEIHPLNPAAKSEYMEYLCVTGDLEKAREIYVDFIVFNKGNYVKPSYDYTVCKYNFGKLTLKDLKISGVKMDEYTSVLNQNPYLLVTSDNYKWLKELFDFWDENIDFAHSDDEFQAFKSRFEEVLAKQLNIIHGYDMEYLNGDTAKTDHDYVKTDYF